MTKMELKDDLAVARRELAELRAENARLTELLEATGSQQSHLRNLSENLYGNAFNAQASLNSFDTGVNFWQRRFLRHTAAVRARGAVRARNDRIYAAVREGFMLGKTFDAAKIRQGIECKTAEEHQRLGRIIEEFEAGNRAQAKVAIHYAEQDLIAAAKLLPAGE